MSFFKNLFGSKPKPAESQDKPAAAANLTVAIQRNREAIETLEKRQQLIERKIAAQLEEAKTRAANNDKRGALLVLKRKKLLEQELESLMNSHMTLEQQILSLESAQTSQLAVQALQQGIAAQKRMGNQVNIDQVDQLMEDMQEQQELQSEIAQVLSQGARITDDAALLEELEELQTQELEKKLPATSSKAAVSIPSIPSTAPVVTVSAPPVLSRDEEDELAALQAGLH